MGIVCDLADRRRGGPVVISFFINYDYSLAFWF